MALTPQELLDTLSGKNEKEPARLRPSVAGDESLFWGQDTTTSVGATLQAPDQDSQNGQNQLIQDSERVAANTAAVNAAAMAIGQAGHEIALAAAAAANSGSEMAMKEVEQAKNSLQAAEQSAPANSTGLSVAQNAKAAIDAATDAARSAGSAMTASGLAEAAKMLSAGIAVFSGQVSAAVAAASAGLVAMFDKNPDGTARNYLDQVKNVIDYGTGVFGSLGNLVPAQTAGQQQNQGLGK